MNLVGNWVAQQVGISRSLEGMTCIGMLKEGVLVGGILYEGYTGTNIFMHCASDGSKRWLTKSFLHAIFAYPFLYLGCKRVSGLTPATNHRAVDFNRKIGLEFEAVIEEGCRSGDLILTRMWKKDCRWLLSDKLLLV